MKRYLLPAAAMLAAGSALAQMSAPGIGIASDWAGAVRPVVGVAGNLLIGEALVTGANSAAASGRVVLIKTATDVRALDAAGHEITRAAAPSGSALFAFANDGSPAWVWMPRTQSLLGWCAGSFCSCPLPMDAIDGEVVAIGAADRSHINLAVNRNDALEVLHVRIRDGAVAATTPLPGAVGAPLLLPDGRVIYSVSGALVERDARGKERRSAFPHSAASIAPMSAGWVLVSATGERRHFAVRVADGAAFQIPEVQ